MSVKCAFFDIFQKIMVFCCAIFFGFANAFSANLPSGYTELEYIQSSGTQYINTGFAPTANYKHTIVFETLSSGTGYLCGTGSAGGRSGNVKLTGNNILDIYNNASGTGAAGILGNVQLAQGKNTLVLDLRNASKSYVSLNGVNLETPNTNTYITSSLSVTLFGSGSASSVPLRIYESIIEQNGVVIAHFVPAKNSSGVVGMYDTVNNVFYTNQGTGEFTAGPVVPENPIKIATTAYNSARFSPVVTDLNSTVATIRDVVTNTINQTAAIADLQATKQTRPDAECPKFRQCLLVEDNNNIPHWYLIKDPVRDLVKSLRDNKINNAGETTTTAYAANGYDGTNGTTDSRYYKGYPAMRKLADGSTSVNNRQFGVALTGSNNGGQYKTLGDQEWAVTWNGNETGTADSFLPGVIYGTSRCSKVKPSSTAVGTEGWTTIENSEPTNDAANIASYVNCYCKMTGVGVDGEFTPVRDSSRAPWVFYNTISLAASCARYCASYCAGSVRGTASFRQSLMGWAVE